MSIIFSLPDIIIEIILTEWVEWRDFVSLDTAMCITDKRVQFLSFLSQLSPMYLLLQYGDLIFRDMSISNLNSKNKDNILDNVVEYCSKRKVRFANVRFDCCFPETGKNYRNGEVFFHGIKYLDIVIDNTSSLSIEQLRKFRNFRNIHRLRIEYRGQWLLPFNALCQQFCEDWPFLTSISLDIGSGKLSTIDLSYHSLHMENSMTIRDSFSSACHLFSQLRVLQLPSVDLDPVHVYILFVQVGMNYLEQLELPSLPAHWSSRYGGTRFNPFSRIRLPERNNCNSLLNNGEEDEDEYIQVDSSIANSIRVRLYSRPRKGIHSRVRDFDDFCQLIVESKSSRSSLSALQTVKGNYVYIYPLLTLMSERLKELSMSLHSSSSDFEARVSVADGLNRQSFRHLSGLATLNIFVAGTMKHELNTWDFSPILWGAAGSLQRIRIERIQGDEDACKDIFSTKYLPMWMKHLPSTLLFTRLEEMQISYIAGWVDDGTNQSQAEVIADEMSLFLQKFAFCAPNLRKWVWTTNHRRCVNTQSFTGFRCLEVLQLNNECNE